MNSILVVCTGNTCRSPMAEGIINAIIEEQKIKDVSVESAGLSADVGNAPSENAVLALGEIDIDISKHRSQPVLTGQLESADCIYVMTEQHKNVIIDALPEVTDKIVVMDISDPFGQELPRYRECREEMLNYFTKELLNE